MIPGKAKAEAGTFIPHQAIVPDPSNMVDTMGSSDCQLLLAVIGWYPVLCPAGAMSEEDS